MFVSTLWFNTQFSLEKAPHALRLKFGSQILRPTIGLSFENDNYQVKTADTPDEIAQVLRLRFDVFFREFSTNKVSFSLFPYDIDVYDFMCDHLIVKDKTTQNIIACYRLLLSESEKKTKAFYSESEFDISSFIKTPSKKLELGRACVHKDYRKGAVIGLLWKGLMKYARKSQVRYLFGCSSVNRNDFGEVPTIMKQLEKRGSFIEDFDLQVRPKYRMNFSISEEESCASKGKGMNSLMHMYLLSGAKMSKKLAYDQQMDCLDIFTLLDLHDLPASFERKFS